MITGKFNDAQWRQLVRQLERLHTDKSLPDIIRQRFRAFLKDLLKVLPPRSQAIGRKAISKDLNRIFVQRDEGYLGFALRTFGRKHVRQALRNKRGEPYLIEYDEITFSRARVRQFHAENKTKAGRVTKAGQRSLDIGRWRSHNMLWISSKMFNSYLAEVRKNVGLLKSWFAYSYRHVGGKVPSWISRHFPKVSGSFKNHLRKSGNPHLILRAPIFNDKKFSKFIDFALTVQLNRMQREVDFLIKRRLRK